MMDPLQQAQTRFYERVSRAVSDKFNGDPFIEVVLAVHEYEKATHKSLTPTRQKAANAKGEP